MRTITYGRDIIFRSREVITLEFQCDQIPLHIDCRILERSSSPRIIEEHYLHPDPPFSRLFLFQSGGARVSMDGASYELSAGKIYLLPAGHPFAVTYQPSELVYLHLHVSDITGESVMGPLKSLTALQHPRLFRALSEAYRRDDIFALLARTTETVGILLEDQMQRLTDHARAVQQFSQLFTWLKTQRPARVTVSDAAELYHVTPDAFAKRFRRTMDVSFKAYLTSLQLRSAQHQLLYTDRTVAQIAKDLGHTYPQYFHRFFKAHCGCTPSQYRQRTPSS